MSATFDNFQGLPAAARDHLLTLEIFVGDMENETDAYCEDAVKAINALAAMLKPNAEVREALRSAIVHLEGAPDPEDIAHCVRVGRIALSLPQTT